MAVDPSRLPVGQKVLLPGHFDQAVTLEGVRPLGKGFECRVRLASGALDETVISEEEAYALAGDTGGDATTAAPADAEQVRLLIESTRIRLAYTHDPHFAVSLSGIRTLPHQIEAVYMKMLPQPRLRFLLADDPGAGKTIMAGLLVKELKLREAIDRVLILCPSPLTIQWQDEMQRWFGEEFAIIFSAVDHGRDGHATGNHGQDAHATSFSVVPADILLDLPAAPGYGSAQAGLPVHPAPPESVRRFDAAPAADFLKATYQTERRETCQKERQRFVAVCRDYLEQSFTARVRAAQNRVMALRAREGRNPDLPAVASPAETAGAKAGSAIARQRAENDLADLQRTRQERLDGLKRLEVARHGPLRHLATAVVLPVRADGTEAVPPDGTGGSRSVATVFPELDDDLDPETKRKIELAAEDVVIAYESGRGWETERVGHLKIGFDIRSLGPADGQTGYRDPVHGVRRIEVKGRKKGQPIRLTTNEWYKAQQLGDSFWLYVVWSPLEKPDTVPVMIQNPAKILEHAAKPVVSARFWDIPASEIDSIAKRAKE